MPSSTTPRDRWRMAIDTRPELADLPPAETSAPRVHRDFAEKVAGTLKYADDWTLPGMLHGVIVRSPVACGADRKSTRLNSSHMSISYAVFCLKKKTQ